MSRSSTLALAVADAFCAGPWTSSSMLERARTVIRRADLEPQLSMLARSIRYRYPVAPLHATTALAHTIDLVIDQRRLGALERLRDAKVRTWPYVPSAMGPARWPVERIDSVEMLARAVRLDTGVLAWLADQRMLERSTTHERLRNYRYRWIPKTGGRWRLIEAPKPATRDLQRWVLDHILSTVPVHPAAMGFVRSRSIVDAAARHTGAEVVVRMDLEDFFWSIRRSRVRAVYRSLGYPEQVADMLSALSTNVVPNKVLAEMPEGSRPLKPVLRAPHLPQGAPTSPALANLVAYRLDCRLSGLAQRFAMSYTRYADDLVFSGDRLGQSSVVSLMGWVQAVAEEEGFVVNHRKTRVMPRSQRQVVGGLVVNEQPNVSRTERDALRAILHNCVVHGVASQMPAGSTPEQFRAHLLGRIAWVGQSNPAAQEQLFITFRQINWPI